jgi:hypothetical protein
MRRQHCLLPLLRRLLLCRLLLRWPLQQLLLLPHHCCQRCALLRRHCCQHCLLLRLVRQLG